MKLDREHLVIAALYSPAVLAVIFLALYSPSGAWGLDGIDCFEEICITDILNETADINEEELFERGQEIGGHAKNLIMSIHEVDMALVTWIADKANVTLPPVVLSSISIGLLFGLAFVVIRIFIKTLKHAALVAVIAVILIMVAPVPIE